MSPLWIYLTVIICPHIDIHLLNPVDNFNILIVEYFCIKSPLLSLNSKVVNPRAVNQLRLNKFIVDFFSNLNQVLSKPDGVKIRTDLKIRDLI